MRSAIALAGLSLVFALSVAADDSKVAPLPPTQAANSNDSPWHSPEQVAALRKRAQRGDVEAAIVAETQLSLEGDYKAAAEVLRDPALRGNPDVEGALRSDIGMLLVEQVRFCDPIDRKLVDEYAGLLRSQSKRADKDAVADLQRFKRLRDPYDRDELATYFATSLAPNGLACKRRPSLFEIVKHIFWRRGQRQE